MTWGEEMEMVYESGQLEQEGQGDEMMQEEVNQRDKDSVSITSSTASI